MDVLWAVFVLLGIEKVRIAPGITATNPLDLYFMPYTHGLLSALLWGGAAMFVTRLFPRIKRWGTSAIVGSVVFSHWLLDLLVHRPDLPLYDNAMKVGMGLWNFPMIAFGLEIGLLAAGSFLYLRKTKPLGKNGRYDFIFFGMFMIAVQAMVFFGKQPTSDTEIAISALLSYFLFAAVAFWLERKRMINPVGQ